MLRQTGSHSSPSGLAAHDAVAAFNRRLTDAVGDYLRTHNAASTVPIVMIGDHSCAVGTWTAVRRHLRHPVPLLYVDAHLDANTVATSPSGNAHGMPVATLAGLGAPVHDLGSGDEVAIDGRALAFVGTRSVDVGERERVEAIGARVFDMTAVGK